MLKYYIYHVLFIKGDQDLGIYNILIVFILVLLAGCIAPEPAENPEQQYYSTPVLTVPATPEITTIPAVQITPVTIFQTPPAVDVQYKEPLKPEDNHSVAMEVNYREYVDWFLLNNNNIRYYTSYEYVCGQYTVDMINASEKAGFKAYFGTIRFSDDTGHALVGFKSTFSGYTSWYFFEPQTNKIMTQQTISQIVQQNMGKKVNEVTVYGYFDDAGDKDPASWRFAYPLYNKKY